MTTKPVDPPDEKPHVILPGRTRWVVTAGVMLGLFLAALEATVVSTAMPTVIGSLGGLDRYSWVFTAYLLSATVSVPAWGRLSDIYGRRPLYLWGIAIFLIGSALSGMSGSITELILFRALQGLGAGAILPLSLTIAGDLFSSHERPRIQGLFSGVWGLASIVGPLAGGIITEQISWRWVFYINIPFGIAAALVVGLALVEPRKIRKAPLDYQGALWMALSLTLLLVALVETGDPGAWNGPLIPLTLTGAIIAGALFVRAERRAEDPIVPFSLFRNRVVVGASVTGFLIGTAMFGALSFIPLFIQGTQGGSPIEAGTALTPVLLGWVITAIVGGQLLRRVGPRFMVYSGLLALVVSFAILATVGRATPRWILLTDLALMGAGMGLIVLTTLILTQNSVDRGELGIATSMTQFTRSIGGVFGVAIMGAVLTFSLSSQLSEIEASSGLPPEQVQKVVENPGALIEPGARDSLPPPLLNALSGALDYAIHNAFLVGVVFSVLALISGFWIPMNLAPTPERVRETEEFLKSPAECERLLVAEMTTIDPEREPVAVDPE